MSADLLPVDDARLLEQCEQTIERGLATFVDVGRALLDIRDGRLYRQSHATFEAYCGERWNLTRQHVNRTIDAAQIAGALEPTGSIPRAERVARELAPLRAAPEQMREAWSETVREHGEKPTAKQVRETVRKLEDRLLPNAIRDEHGDVVNKHAVHALSASVQVKVNELYRLVVLTPGVLDLLDPGDREDVMRDLLIGDNVIAGIRKALTDTTLRVVEGGLA